MATEQQAEVFGSDQVASRAPHGRARVPRSTNPALLAGDVLRRAAEGLRGQGTGARRGRRPSWALLVVLVLLVTGGLLHGGIPTTMPPLDRGSALQERQAPPAAGRFFAASLRPAAAPATGAGGQAGPGAAAGTTALTLGRLIARTGEVFLQVRDVERDVRAVSAIALGERGYVAESNSAAGTAADGGSTATLTLRVPAGRFGATMEALAGLPHSALRQRSGSQDITDSVHDLQAQLEALQTTRAQLLVLMRRTRTTADAMAVLDRLTDVNTRIDATRGGIMASTQSVVLSTIAVSLTPEPRPVARLRRAGWQPGRDLVGALTNVGLLLQTLVSAMIYLIVYVALPGAVVVAVLLARRLRQRTT